MVEQNKEYTLRVKIESDADEVASRTAQVAELRASLAAMLESGRPWSGPTALRDLTVVVAAIRRGEAWSDIEQMDKLRGWPALFVMLREASDVEHTIWTHYTITHDEMPNDAGIEWIELMRRGNRFYLSIVSLVDDNYLVEHVTLTQRQAQDYMRDTIEAGWACEEWSEGQIQFFTALQDWRWPGSGRKAGRPWFGEYLK